MNTMQVCSSLLHTNAKVRLLVCHSSYDVVHTMSALAKSLETVTRLNWLSPYIGHLVAEHRLDESCCWTLSATDLQHPSGGVKYSAWVNNQMMEWLNMGTCVQQSCSVSPLACIFFLWNFSIIWRDCKYLLVLDIAENHVLLSVTEKL